MTVDPLQAVWLSLQVGALATLLALLPAVALGYALARGRFRGKSLLGALVMAPMVLPPVVTGLVLLRLLGRNGPLGPILDALGLPVSFTLLGAVVAAAVVGFPMYVITIRAAFEAVDPRLEQVSHSLGVPPGRTFLRVTLPLAAPGIAAGVVLAFARGLGEFGATAVLAGNMEGRTRTIALAVYSLMEQPGGDEPTRALLRASMGLSLGALAAFEALNRWQRRRLDLDRG